MRLARRLYRRALFWAIAYLALVPAFALAYDALGYHSFYDSNAKLERGAYEDATGLRLDLSRALDAHLGDRAWRPTSNQIVKLDPRELDVTGIELTTEQRLLLEVSGVYRSPGAAPLLAGVFHLWVEPTLRQGASAIIRHGRPVSRLVPVALSLQTGSSIEEPKRGPFEPPISLLFPGLGGSHGSPTAGTFAMSEATYQELFDFYLGLNGDPSYASDHFLRMLYLSAVTVTTLGFGDITPVSEAARALVAAEAVGGVVLIGLFLNALAGGGRRRRGAESSGEAAS